MSRIFLTYLLLLTASLLYRQPVCAQVLSESDLAYFRQHEDSLLYLQGRLFSSKTDSARFKNNAKFLHKLEEVLLNDLSFYYPFDSLKEISRLVPPDKRFRLITWNISRNDGSQYYYFGFLQSLNPKTHHYDLYQLTDKSPAVKNPESYISDNSKWFGMLYYSVIPADGYYTLLAWDGNDKLVCRKFIDVLSFKKDGSPVFGKDVFKLPKKNPKRIMFEYSAKVVMSLRYHPNEGAIVFDHLAAKDEYNEGQYQFYGPDFSYDAFLPKRGKWVYTPDVDIKNPRNKNDNVRRDKKKDKPIYVPR